jgi:very-short-patch-repair endonuclease
VDFFCKDLMLAIEADGWTHGYTRERDVLIQSENAARACDVMATTAGCVSLRSALMA